MTMAERIRAYVVEYPGSTAGQIGAALGGTAAFAVAPMAVYGFLRRVKRKSPKMKRLVWHYFPASHDRSPAT